MRMFALPLTLLAGILLVAMHTSPAQAQLNRTWVASNGNNANNCGDGSYVAGLVTVSTLLGMVSIPLCLAMLGMPAALR